MKKDIILKELDLNKETMDKMIYLFELSYKESYTENNPMFFYEPNVDKDYFIELYNLGYMQNLVLTYDDNIVGYCIMNYCRHDQCVDIICASCVSIYIKKEFRNLENFNFLLDETERRLKEKNVTMIDFSIPEKLSKLFERRKYKKEQITYVKHL